MEELRQAFERVVLRLHRHEHAVGRGERVDRQRPERRRAIEEDEVVAVGAGGESLGEIPLAVGAARELDHGAREIRLRGNEVEIRERGRMNELGKRRAVEEVIARRSVRAHPKPRGRVRLRIEVDHERALAGLGQAGGEVDGGRRFPDTAFLVRNGVDAAHGRNHCR